MKDVSTAKPGFYGWINVSLLFVIYMAAFGMVYYGFSVIFPMMIKSLEWNRGTASIAHSLSAIFMGLLTPVVAFSIQKFGPKKTMMTGFIVLLTGMLLMGTIMSQMWQWVVLWGLVVAFGLEFGGAIAMQTILLYWFNFKRATALGIVMTGAAVGGFVAQPLYSWLMGFTNTWRSGWLFGAVFVLLGLICTIFVVNKPADIGQHPDGLSPEEVKQAAEQNIGQAKIYKTSEIWGVKEALKTHTFWFFVILDIGHLMALTFIASHGILNFLDRGFSLMQAPLIFSAVLLGSAVIRFPIGLLGDKIEPRHIINVSFGIMAIMLFLIWTNQSIQMIMVAGFLFGSCYGAQLIMFPTLIGNYFGPEAFAGINGMLGPIFVVFGAIVPMGAGYIFENVGSYDPVYIFLVGLLAVAFAFSFFLKPPERKHR